MSSGVESGMGNMANVANGLAGQAEAVIGKGFGSIGNSMEKIAPLFMEQETLQRSQTFMDMLKLLKMRTSATRQGGGWGGYSGMARPNSPNNTIG